MKDKDAQFLCKDCARFNLCQYYDKRKGDSYICKYFHLTETDLEKIEKLKKHEEEVQEAYYKGKIEGIHECTAKLKKMNEELWPKSERGDKCLTKS